MMALLKTKIAEGPLLGTLADTLAGGGQADTQAGAAVMMGMHQPP
jgi:hypothetical protein